MFIRCSILIIFNLLVAWASLAQPIVYPDVRQNKANVFTQPQTIDYSASNYLPGTTKHLNLKNSGGYTWQDYTFGSTLKAATGASSSGGLYDYVTGGQCRYFYSLSFQQYAAECGGGYDHYYGYISGNGGVRAGGNGTPSSTLEVSGSTELKSEKITSNTTLGSTYTYVLCDASANSCTGTPSSACSSYSTQVNCQARDSHGGCAWIPVDCSTWNGNETDCNNNSGYGCSYETASCSGAGDESSCLSQDDSYGGNCTYDNSPQDCSVFGDESTCTSYMGCTWNPESTADCSAFNGDQTTCEATSGCSYSDPDCSGTYVTASAYCSGSYDSYSCNGSYNTGTCSGSGGYCNGTPTCAGIDDSTSCGGETGCTWSTAITLTMPSLNSSYNGRSYWIKNIASSGSDCILQANTGQDIDGASTYTLANYKDSTHVMYHELTAACSAYNNNESSCTSTTGCSWSGCSQYSDSESCTGSSYSCSWDGSTCTGSNGDCNGNYTSAKRWFEMSKR